MAQFPLLESGSPDWEQWPDESVVEGCEIKVLRANEGDRRAYSVTAEPAATGVDTGASIFYVLSPQGTTAPMVRPSIKAFWSSRRAGPFSKDYFNRSFPQMEVAVLQALEELDRQPRTSKSERGVAVLHFCLTPHRKGLGLRKEDNVPSLLKDDSRFEEVARRWLEIQRSTSVGARTIATAQNHVNEARRWFQSLETYQALAFPPPTEKGTAKLTQTAVYKALKDAAVQHAGIPLLRQVREAFLDVVVAWDQQRNQHRQPIKTEAQRESAMDKAKKEPRLRLDAFDKAKDDLGFSWLPKSWPKAKTSDPSD